MYSRGEATAIRQEFWTAFGKYMSPVPSAEGFKINWINYHTRVRDVHFRMDAGSTAAAISITLEHKDDAIRALYYEQLLELKTLLHITLEEEWTWQPTTSLLTGRVISRVVKELPNISIFNKDQWPDLISFFKPRIIALDNFWENARLSFEDLR